MSKQYDNNMRGVLFKNNRKEQDKHPDYQGQCEINGTEYWVSGWIKEPKQPGGDKFMSLSFQPKDKSSGGQRGGSSGASRSQPSAGKFEF